MIDRTPLFDLTWSDVQKTDNSPLLRSWLEKVTYKPGWRLSIGSPHTDMIYGYQTHFLIVQTLVPDSYRPDEMFPLSVSAVIPPPVIMDEGAFMHWLARHLIDIERHESREWFKVDGLVFDDPHQGDPRRL